ncbi:MAG: hypothetical protein DRO40_01040 [Thermoprotei archaeon]|nr:MAG: hypothetical protein DRO40_01040 [Thermoprotei archaeon]
MAKILGPPSPNGSFVLILDKSIRDRLLRLYGGRIIVEDYGETVIVKTKSRRIAIEIIRRFQKYLKPI